MHHAPQDQQGPGPLTAAGGDGLLPPSTGVGLSTHRELSVLSRYDTSFGLASDTDGGRARDDTWSSQEDPLRGATLGDVTIETLIAEGGMGRVYRGQQRHPPRPVAVKFMRQGRSRVMAERFRQEVELLGRLVHPNIAQVFIAGECALGLERVPYFVMEFIPNAEPLVRYAIRKQLTTLARVELFVQVCDAIAEGHRQAIVHRDLKPGNLLVSNGSIAPDLAPDSSAASADASSDPSTCDQRLDSPARVKVIDFGIAKALTPGDEQTGVTETGDFLGTRQYMSPEQFSGQSAVVIDARSDVYSLGVVLHELVTGTLPYDVAGRSLLETARIIHEQPPALLTPAEPRVAARTTRGLRQIVGRCLEKAPDDRYPDAAALAADLRRLLEGKEIAAPRAFPRLTSLVRTRPLRATTVIAALCGMILLTVPRVSWQGTLPTPSPETTVEPKSVDDAAGGDAAPDRLRGGFNTNVSGSRPTPLEWVMLQFDRPPTRPLTLADFRLTHDGQPVDLSDLELENAGGASPTWFLRGLRPLNSKQGAYELTFVDDEVRDVRGHAYEGAKRLAWSMPPFVSFSFSLDDDAWKDHVISMEGIECYTEKHAAVPATFIRPLEPGREGTIVMRFAVDFPIHAASLAASLGVWTTGDPFPYDPGAWALIDVSRDGQVWENLVTLGPNQSQGPRPPWNIQPAVEGSREVWVRARLTGTTEWPEDGMIFSQFLRTSTKDNKPAFRLDLAGAHPPVIPAANDAAEPGP